MTRSHRTTSAVLAAALALLLLLVACGGDDSAGVVDDSSPTTADDGGEPLAGSGERSSDTTTTEAQGSTTTTTTGEAQGSSTTTEDGEPTTTEGDGDTTTTPAEDGGEPIAGRNDEVDTEDEADNVDWAGQADDFHGQNGVRVGFDCPGGGDPEAIWGDGTYTDDSSVCTAAVHAGLISLDEGGRVVVEITRGQSDYEGTEANGITSMPYGMWEGSFTFPGA